MYFYKLNEARRLQTYKIKLLFNYRLSTVLTKVIFFSMKNCLKLLIIQEGDSKNYEKLIYTKGLIKFE